MRYINMNYYRVLVACILGGMTLFSCSKDEEEENEWTANYVYIQRDNNLAIDFFKIVHNPLGIQGDISYTFFAKTKYPVTKDVTVMFESHGDVPADKVSFSKKEVVIKAGEVNSEYVTATVSDWSFMPADKAEKSIGFSISISDMKANEKNIRISSTQKAKSIKVLKGAYSLLSFNMPTNWVAVDRSKWEASASSTYTPENMPAAAIDGDLVSTWFAYGTVYDSNKQCWLNVKLDKSINLTGFSITKDSYFGGYDVKQATIQVKKSNSSDWITYEDVYQFGLFSGNGPQFIILDSMIENVLEFRMQIIAPNDFVGLSELNLYVNK